MAVYGLLQEFQIPHEVRHDISESAYNNNNDNNENGNIATKRAVKMTTKNDNIK